MKRVISLVFLLVFFYSAYSQTVNRSYMDGVLYFQLSPAYPWEQVHVGENDLVDRNDFPFLQTLFEKYGVNCVVRPFHLFGNEELLRVMEVHFDSIGKIDAFVDELSGFEQISYAEKVPLMRPMYKPNDPYYGIVSNRNWKWHLDLIKADSAWEIQRGKPNIKVAVVDGFVWGAHPDLQIDSSNLCSVSYSYGGGYSYSVGSATPPSSIGQYSNETAYNASHGTHCAGLVGAINDNGEGIASIGGGVTLMGVATTTAQYSEYILYGMQGVQWAAENGAKVISMSFGGEKSSSTQQNLMKTCHDAGIVLLAAAGNEGDEDNSIIYPGGYSTVISVASVDGDGRLSYFSQWGTGRADIAAPGGFIAYNSSAVYPNILSTTYNKSYLCSRLGFSGTFYDGMQGTSMACPVAAGVVGLMLSNDSTLSPDLIKIRLQMTATPLNTNSEHTIDGYGYINAYAALLYKYVMVSKKELYFPKEANKTDSVYVAASESWTLSNVPSWLTVNRTSGDSGTTLLVFTTSSENSGAERSVQLTISTVGAGSTSLTLTQQNYSFIMDITPKKIVLGSARQMRDTICIHSTVDWLMVNSSSWLATDIQKISKDSSIIAIATRSTNTWGRNRETYLVFSADGMSDDSVCVIQKMADFISLSAAVKNIGAYKEDTVSIFVYSNVPWTVTPDATYSWIASDVTKGADTMQVTFIAKESNNTSETRSASFTITDGSITKTITIRQSGNVGVANHEPVAIMSIHPNPAEHQVQIHFEKKVSELQVTDLLGKIVYQGPVSGNEVTLDVSLYPQGIYLVRGSDDSQTVAVSKFVKK